MTWFAADDQAELDARRREASREPVRSKPCPPAAFYVPPNAPAVGGTRAFQLSMVGPGWQLWSTARTHADDVEPEFRTRRGGVCVEVVHDELVTEDGEIIKRTRYRCVIPYRGQLSWSMLDAGEVDLDALEGMRRSAVTTTVRWLLRPLVNSKGAFRSSDFAAFTDARRLMESVTL